MLRNRSSVRIGNELPNQLALRLVDFPSKDALSSPKRADGSILQPPKDHFGLDSHERIGAADA